MSKTYRHCAFALPFGLLLALPLVQAADKPGVPAVPSGEVEPLGYLTGYKSPGPGMAFTAGIPLRVLADGIDPEGYRGKTQKMESAEVHFFVDGKLQAKVEPARDGYNYFETTFKDLTVGKHVLTVECVNVGNRVHKGWPVPISVEAMPTHANTVELKEDLVLKGAANLTWDDITVKGNGFRVRSDPNWTGSIQIKKSFITGLGIYTSPGIDASTSGSITIQDTIFEGTGAVFLHVNGSGAVEVKNNEFRASNFIKFVASNPTMSPVFYAQGNTTGTKRFQGNRVGSGIVRFERTSGWLIGGNTDAESNILMGPRCVIDLINCKDMQVRGNYIHHNYYGGWSQGFALYCQGSQNILAEHNVVRQSSWPIQSFAGEFRYNLVVDCGHNWVRQLMSNTKMHHNLFIHTNPGGNPNSGVWLYNGLKDVAIYNNTFDAGAPIVRDFGVPLVDVSAGCGLSTLRNNIFTGLAAQNGGGRQAIISGGKGALDAPRIAYADYNCFFNPQAANMPRYAEGIVKDKPGAHDVAADPKFAKGTTAPYPINEAEVWNQKFKTSQVLAYYRQRYTPAAGSPLLGGGDPADGPNSFIGAVGPGKGASDLFGRFGEVKK